MSDWEWLSGWVVLLKGLSVLSRDGEVVSAVPMLIPWLQKDNCGLNHKLILFG